MLTEDQLRTIELAAELLTTYAGPLPEPRRSVIVQVAADLRIMKVDLHTAYTRPYFCGGDHAAWRTYGRSPGQDAIAGLPKRPTHEDVDTTLDDAMCPPEDLPGDDVETCTHGYEIDKHECQACEGVCIHGHLLRRCQQGCSDRPLSVRYKFPRQLCSCKHLAQIGDDPSGPCRTCRLVSEDYDRQRAKIAVLAEQLRQAKERNAPADAIERLEKLLEYARYFGD